MKEYFIESWLDKQSKESGGPYTNAPLQYLARLSLIGSYITRGILKLWNFTHLAPLLVYQLA